METKKKWIAGLVALALMLGLCGCATTAEEMYVLPRRSESYENLQAAMDPVMEGKEFAAPTSGDNRQPVQMADLDGDGQDEVLVFAAGSGEAPLTIFVFRMEDGAYGLLCSIACSGTEFDQVEYLDMDGKAGLELAVGQKIGSMAVGTLTVYRLTDGVPELVMNADYDNYLSCDLNSDERGDLLLIRGGDTVSPASTVTLYTMAGGSMERSVEVQLSRPREFLKRIVRGGLCGGGQAVFIASMGEEADTIITDVITMVEGNLTNVTAHRETGTSVKTVRNYYVYAADIDQDGQVELPSLIQMRAGRMSGVTGNGEHMIRWYAMTAQGEEVDKMYTFHNYFQGWYLELSEESVGLINVEETQTGGYQFSLWDTNRHKWNPLWQIHVLTGEDRSAVATEDGGFILMKTDTVVYACALEKKAMELGVTQEMVTDAFHLIQSDWNTGEM